MGISLFALVELHVPACTVPGSGSFAPLVLPAHWTDVSHWDFGKDYALMRALRDTPGLHRKWPKDQSFEAKSLRDKCYADQGLCWLPADRLPPRELPSLEEGEPAVAPIFWSSLLASLAPLGDRGRVRVLFYEL